MSQLDSDEVPDERLGGEAVEDATKLLATLSTGDTRIGPYKLSDPSVPVVWAVCISPAMSD